MRKVKKIMGVIVAQVLLIVTLFTPTTAQALENPFSDVSATEYYYKPVLWAVGDGITTGVNPTSFSPNGKCTRAQVVTFLWRAAGEPEPITTNNPFVDVESNSTFYKAILWASENGITTGVDPTHFRPNVSCTRAQIVTFLWRYAGKPVFPFTNPFVDVPNDSTFKNAIIWAAVNEITSGTGNQFYMNRTCTRAQTVTFLFRYKNPGVSTDPNSGLTPVYYRQDDPNWANVKFGNWSMQQAGCAPTALAMIVNGILHNGVKPLDVATFLYDNTEEFNKTAYGSTALASVYVAKHYGLQYVGIDTLETLKTVLTEGKIVRIAVGAGYFTSDGYTHAIVLFGNDNGYTFVYDPLGNGTGTYSINKIWEVQSTDPIDLKGGYVGYAFFE